MRDMRLAFWSSVYGCASLLCVIISRILSAYLITSPAQTPLFLDPLNYILTFISLLLLFRATILASASIKKLRTGKNLLTAVQMILIFDMFYLLTAQVLRFTLSIEVNKNIFVIILSILVSLPSVIGLYALYFSKQLRSNVQYFALAIFFVSIFWVILRLCEKVVLPLLAQHAAISENALRIANNIVDINDELSFILYAVALVSTAIYAYFCAKATLKMPERQD